MLSRPWSGQRLVAAVSLAVLLVPVSSRRRASDVARVAGRRRDGRARGERAASGGPPGLAGLLRERAEAAPLWGEGTTIAVDPPAKTSTGGAVPLPLAPDAWRRVTGKDGVPDDRLAAAILEDRRASLLYRGLASLDEPTLRALAEDLPTLRRIYEDHAVAFAAFGSFFRVRDGAVAVPGGAEAAASWESLVGVSRGAPVLFLERLLAANGGRRAFLFDSVARLDPGRQRFALGMGGAPGKSAGGGPPAAGRGLRPGGGLVALPGRHLRPARGGRRARPEGGAARDGRSARAPGGSGLLARRLRGVGAAGPGRVAGGGAPVFPGGRGLARRARRGGGPGPAPAPPRAGGVRAAGLRGGGRRKPCPTSSWPCRP